MVEDILGSSIGGMQAFPPSRTFRHGHVAKLLRGAGLSYVMLCAGVVVGLGLQLLIARTLGLYEYSTYTVAVAWLGTLAIVSRLGYDTALIRFLPAYRARDEWHLFRGILATSSRLVCLASIGIAVLGLTITWFLRIRMGGPLALSLAVAFVTLPFLSQIGLRQSALRALQRMVGASFPESIVRQFVLGGLILFAPLLGATFTTAPWIMIANLVATSLTLVFANGWLNRAIPTHATRPLVMEAVGGNMRSAWARVSTSLFAMTLINLVLNQADVVLLGIFGDLRQVGLYATAARLASLASFGLLAVNAILASMIPELYSTGQRRELQRVVTRSARVSLLAMLACVTFMVVAGRQLLDLFGPEFRESYGALLILLAGHAANTIGGSVGFLMTMTGHERRALTVIGGSAALNVCLHVAFIPSFGMLGAATATAVATLVWNALMVADAWRHLRIDPTALGRFANRTSFEWNPVPLLPAQVLPAQGVVPCPDQTS